MLAKQTTRQNNRSMRPTGLQEYRARVGGRVNRATLEVEPSEHGTVGR